MCWDLKSCEEIAHNIVVWSGAKKIHLTSHQRRSVVANDLAESHFTETDHHQELPASKTTKNRHSFHSELSTFQAVLESQQRKNIGSSWTIHGQMIGWLTVAILECKAWSLQRSKWIDTIWNKLLMNKHLIKPWKLWWSWSMSHLYYIHSEQWYMNPESWETTAFLQSTIYKIHRIYQNWIMTWWADRNYRWYIPTPSHLSFKVRKNRNSIRFITTTIRKHNKLTCSH